MLTNPTPIETPAVEAKVYDKLHVLSLTAAQPSIGKGMLSVNLLPATATGELASADKVQRFSCPLYPAMNEVPELAAAFAAVLAAIPAVIAWKTAKSTAGAHNE